MINPGYYNQIFQISSVPGIILSPDPSTFTIIDVNDAFLKITGSKRPDVIGKKFPDFIKLKPGIYTNETMLLSSLCKAIDSTNSNKCIAGNNTGFGNRWYIENTPLLKHDNTVEYILHTITRRPGSYSEFEFEEMQEAEVEMLAASAGNRSLERKANDFRRGDLNKLEEFNFSTSLTNDDAGIAMEMNKIMQYSPDVICTIDETGRFVQVSAAAKKIWGYEPAELSGRSYLDLVTADDLDLTEKAGLEIISGQVITNFENRCIHKNGSLIPIIWSAKWDNDERVMYCVAKDGTDKKKAELERSLFIFNTDECFILVDRELKIVEFNYQFKFLYKKCLGKDIKKGDNILDYAQPERREKAYELYQRVLKGTEEKAEITLPFEGSSGKVFILNYKPAVNEFGEIIGVFVTAKDVTDIVAAKKQLEASEEKYGLLFHKSPIAKWVYDLDTLQILDVNETAIAQYGYSREDFLSMTVSDIKPKEEQARMKRILQSIREGKGLMHFGIFTQLKKDGTRIKADVSGVKLTFMNRDCMVIESIDVTEKENAMQKLQDNEVKLLSAQKIARLGYWQLLPDTQLLYWSAEVYNIWGVSKKTFEVSRDTFLQTMHPDDVKAYQKEMEAVFAGEKDHDFTHRIMLPGGAVKWVHEKGKLVKDEDGKTILFEGTVQDINDSHEAHEKLLLSEARHRGIVDSQTSYVIRTDLQGRYTYVNNKYKKDFGWIYDNNDLIGQDSLSTVKQYHHMKLTETVRKCFENLNKVFQVELEKPQRDGGTITTLWDFICLTDSTGKPTEVQCVGIDISDRKKAEEALKESNERYEYVSSATSDAIWDCDLESDVTFRGDGFHTLFGYDPAEVDNGKTPWTDYLHPDDKDRVIKNLDVFLAGEKTKWKDEYRYLKADGTYAFVLDKGFAIRSKEGKALKMVGAMHDITERKTLQHLLDKSNRLARIGSWEIDVLNGSVFWSSVTKEIREAEPDFEPDLSLGIHYFKEGKDREIIAARVKECMEHGTPWDDELQIVTQKGNLKWIRTIGEAEMVNGKCIKIYGSFQDIDDKKRTELELLKLYAEKNMILESIGDGFFTVDNNWIVTYWNAQAEKMLRRSKSEVVGQYLWDVFKKREGSRFHRIYHKAIETKQVQHSEDYDETTDKWYEASAYPSGNGLSVYFKDITDRKKAEQAITASNERYAIVSMATNDSIWDWDLEKNEVFRPGKSLESLFGYGSIEPTQVDAFWKTHVQPEDWKRLTRNRNKLLQNPDENYWEDEYRFLKADGGLAYVYDRGYILRNEDGKAVRMIGASRDISKLKENEIELKELNEQLKKWTKELATSNAELEQFAYVASHDLQEPLRMVTGFLTQLEKKYHATLDEKGKQYIHFAIDGAARMRQIMRDLLEYSRVGRAAQMVEKVDLNELVKEVLGLHRKQIKERKAVIKTDKLPVVRASKTPMRQVFLNLIGNSIKYHNGNEQTKVHISCNSTDTHWEFAVTDNGIGIEPEDFERIFIIFQRLHSKEEYSGTGMGLAITKKIIETLGGKIWVTSDAGKGSTFYFTIPKNEIQYPGDKNQKTKHK